MKKIEILKNFLKGGCFGVTIVSISFIFANLIIHGPTDEIKDYMFSIILVFIITGICFNIAKTSIEKMQKKMNVNDRKRVLKLQIVVLTLVTLIIIGLLITGIIYKSTIAIIVYGSLMVGLLLWIIGAYLINQTLKKEVDKINKKLNENKRTLS